MRPYTSYVFIRTGLGVFKYPLAMAFLVWIFCTCTYHPPPPPTQGEIYVTKVIVARFVALFSTTRVFFRIFCTYTYHQYALAHPGYMYTACLCEAGGRSLLHGLLRFFSVAGIFFGFFCTCTYHPPPPPTQGTCIYKVVVVQIVALFYQKQAYPTEKTLGLVYGHCILT